MTLLVTGGAGFIGSNFILDWFATQPALNQSDNELINLDKLTYAANLDNLSSLKSNPAYQFVQADITDSTALKNIFQNNSIHAVVHFAAESHVDRSIEGPEDFIQTNIVGTFRLLEAARAYWQDLPDDLKQNFRFIHVSTDEVYGTLDSNAPAFTEKNTYEPNSPYSASKAASDHLVRAYYHTYGLPVITTNCSNNYGPYQYPEKLIPLCIQQALKGEALPIYGDGQQIRDWLFVSDHCAAIRTVLKQGALGEVYNIGGWNEKANLDVVQTICKLLDAQAPRPDGQSYATQITYVTDRPGHDRRYAIDASKIANDLNWKPEETFESGIQKTVAHYLKDYQQQQQEQKMHENITDW
ncbi:MAG: dTDP-glucose 4,6-dehydratase [Legionella sp.]|nr:dTDP-glucose 4,6-dehydratase [Legionella sp.]